VPGIDLVYGGSNMGLMGKVASAARDGGARVTGIIPRFIHERVQPLDVDELLVVENMHQRKAMMYARADAFIALPGGIGTLEEFSEVFTWIQLELVQAGIGLLNTAGYYDPLVALLQHMVAEKFVRQELLDRLVVHEDPCALLDGLAHFRHSAPAEKWQ
jgi:uncharacterized protein (TIGR00730 family)